MGVSFYVLYNIYDTHIFPFQPFGKITYKSQTIRIKKWLNIHLNLNISNNSSNLQFSRYGVLIYGWMI